MKFLSIIFRRLAKVAVYAMVAVLLGIMVTVIESHIDNVLQKNEVESTSRHQIKQAVHAYQSAHRDARQEEVAQFLREYITRIMPDVLEVIQRPRSASLVPADESIWSFYTATDRLDVYVRPEYIAKETTGADLREVADGVLASFLIFLGILVYVSTNQRAKLERRLHEEERLRLTTALHEQEAFALLGRMTATLSHELRTPVATISNLVQTLPTRMDDAQFAKRFVEIIREELARMQRMIENLLVYGKDLKIDAPEWVELQPLLSVIAKNYGLSLSGAHASIYGDGFYLQLLFTNLLRNSADAGAHEVHLRIRSDEDDVYAILEYEDDGEGFAAEANLNELRSPFVTTRSKGAGLGLYLAEKVVCAHGGIIELYRPARGAGVRLWLSLKSLRISHTRLEGASRATVSSF